MFSSVHNFHDALHRFSLFLAAWASCTPPTIHCVNHAHSADEKVTLAWCRKSSLGTPAAKMTTISVLICKRTTSRPRWWWFHLLFDNFGWLESSWRPRCESLEAAGPQGGLQATPHWKWRLNWLKEDLPSTVSTLPEVQKRRVCISRLVRDETSKKAVFSPAATT